jgi:hypothetical protein
LIFLTSPPLGWLFFGERQAPRPKVLPLKEMNALSCATPIFLTPPQKRLLSEMSKVAELSRLDYVNILDYDPEERTIIEPLNALRNGLTHAFFPENLRSSKPIWNGKNIFTAEGLTLFIEDMSKISDFFLHHNF